MIASNYKCFCARCHYTIWKNEQIELTARRPYHVDCMGALKDSSPRTLDKRYERIYGKLKKPLVIRMLEGRTLLPGPPGRPVGGTQASH